MQLLFANPGYGGTNFRVWDPTAASNSWTAAASDWQGLGDAAVPGVTGDPASTNADVAILKNYAFSGGLGIDMSAAGADGSLALGGISFNSASGPLRIGNSAADTTGTLRLNGGLVDSVANTIVKVAGTSDLTIGDSASGSGTQTMAVELTAAANIVDVASGRTLTIESAIAESGGGSAIQKTGSGTLVLSAANTFTGGTTISGGTLEVASIADSGTSNLGTGGSIAGGAALDATGRTLAVGSDNATTSYSGALTASAFQKQGTGTLTLLAANTFDSVEVQGGGQAITASGLQPTSASLAVTVGGGGGYGAGSPGTDGGSSSILDVTASGGIGGGTAGAGVGGASGSGNAGGANLGTTAAGGGGGAGTNAIASPRTAGDGGIGVASEITGVETYYGGGGAGGGVAGGSGGLGGGGDRNTAGTANTGGGGAGYNAGGSGIVIVRYAGAPAAVGGTIDTVSVPGYTLHTFTDVGAGSLELSPAATMASPIDGTGGFTLDSVGTLTLSANNSYQGGTIVSAGTLVAGHSAALGSGAVTINAGGRLRLDSGSVIANEIADLGSGFFGGTLAFAGGGLARMSTAGGGTLGTLLAGSAATPADLNPAISWSAEIAGTTIADVMSLTNTAGTAQVLSLTYDPTGVAGLSEQDTFLAWLNPQSSTWVNAVVGNTDGTAGYFSGSWADFVGVNPGATPSTALGTYGHDTTTNTVWAVVNHNSDFSVVAVPEPGTLALAGFAAAAAAAGMLHRRRRR